MGLAQKLSPSVRRATISVSEIKRKIFTKQSWLFVFRSAIRGISALSSLSDQTDNQLRVQGDEGHQQKIKRKKKEKEKKCGEMIRTDKSFPYTNISVWN